MCGGGEKWERIELRGVALDSSPPAGWLEGECQQTLSHSATRTLSRLLTGLHPSPCLRETFIPTWPVCRCPLSHTPGDGQKMKMTKLDPRATKTQATFLHQLCGLPLHLHRMQDTHGGVGRSKHLLPEMGLRDPPGPWRGVGVP